MATARPAWLAARNYRRFSLGPQVLLTLIVQPAVFGLLIGRLAVLGHAAPQRIAALAIGAGVFSMWTMTAGGAVIGIFLERESDRLPLVVSSPTSVWTVVMGSVTGAVVASLPALVVSWVGFWAAGARPTAPPAGPLAVGLLATIVSLWLTGLVLAPLLTINDTALLYFNALLYPVVLLSGFVTVAPLPAPLQVVSYVLAPYWGFRILSVLLHAASGGLATPVAGLCASAVVYIATFVVATRLLDRRMRRTGNWLV